MKTLIEKLKFGVLLTGFIFLASCSNNTARISSIGINAVYCTIPLVAKTVTRYTESKISEYLGGTSGMKNGNGMSGKKIEKSGGKLKAKPVSIGVVREARLI